jgi:putative transcriptional regulator
MEAETQRTLRELRARYNLTQREIAEKLGITSIKYLQLEHDSSRIEYHLALSIAKVFDLPASKIFFGKTDNLQLKD